MKIHTLASQTTGSLCKNHFLIYELDHFKEAVRQRKIQHLSEFFILIISLQKAETYYLNRGEETMTCRTVYCLYPGQYSFFEAYAGDFVSDNGIVIMFRAEFFSPVRDETITLVSSGLFNAYSIESIRVIDEKACQLGLLADNMIKEYTGEAELKMELLNALLKLFVIHLMRLNERDPNLEMHPSGDIYLVTRFLDLVNKNYVNWKKVIHYADELCIVPNYLNVKVKKVTGETASYHIQQRIILEAKRKAKCDHLSLKEIAYSLGFEDISHFSKFFKKFAGVSFSRFKKIPV